MKSSLLLVILAVVNLSVFAQNNTIHPENKYKNDLTKNDLLGKVKSLTEYYYDVRKDTVSNPISRLKNVSNFNSTGMLSEMYTYRNMSQKSDSPVNYRKYIYNDKGNLLEIVDKEGKSKKISEYDYNSKGNLIETVYLSDRLSFRFIYNSFGERDTMYSYSRDGKLSSKVVYRYDAKDNRIEEARFKPDGSFDKKEVYIYDKDNHKAQEHHYNSAGVKTGKISYQYDKNRNIISKIDSNKMFIGGLPRKKIGDKIFSKTFQYDVFDKQGNWKTQSLILNDKPVIYKKREITYY